MGDAFNFQRVVVSLILIVLFLFTFSYRGVIEIFSQQPDWEIHKYVYEDGEEGYPINYKAFAIVVTNPQLVDKVEDVVPKRYWVGSNPPPDEIVDYDENHYKLTWYIDREQAESCCSLPKELLSPECIEKGYSKNIEGECILLIILYFYNPDENDVEICNTATAEGDDIKLLEQARKYQFTYIRDGEYHECDLVRPDIPARDSSGEQIDSKGVLELLYEITADIKDQIPNGEFVRLNAVDCPEEEDESANDFSDVGGLDCDKDGEIDIPIDNPYNEDP